MTETVTVKTARAILDLYAEVHQTRTGEPVPTGMNAYRLGQGPVLMVPDAMEHLVASQDDNIYVCDTTGYGHPAIVLEGETTFCGCCYSIDGCWTRTVQDTAEERGLKTQLEPYASWAVSIYPLM